jgi:hypothetical protein
MGGWAGLFKSDNVLTKTSASWQPACITYLQHTWWQWILWLKTTKIYLRFEYKIWPYYSEHWQFLSSSIFSFTCSKLLFRLYLQIAWFTFSPLFFSEKYFSDTLFFSTMHFSNKLFFSVTHLWLWLWIERLACAVTELSVHYYWSAR